MEVVKTYASDSLISLDAERLKPLGDLLNHPFSLCFLHLKWQQTKGLYYLLLACHIIFCLTYTLYTHLFFHTICKPLETKERIVKLQVWERFLAIVDCNISDDISDAKKAIIWLLWISLLVFFILYIIKEVISAIMLGKE